MSFVDESVEVKDSVPNNESDFVKRNEDDITEFELPIVDLVKQKSLIRVCVYLERSLQLLKDVKYRKLKKAYRRLNFWSFNYSRTFGFNYINCICILNRNSFITGHKNGKIRIWETGTGACTSVIQSSDGEIVKVLNLDDNRVIVLDSLGYFSEWNLETKLKVTTFNLQTNQVGEKFFKLLDIHKSNIKNEIISFDIKNDVLSLKKWDLLNRGTFKTYTLEKVYKKKAIDVVRLDKDHFFVKNFKLFDIKTDTCSTVTIDIEGSLAIAGLGNGQILIVGENSNMVYIYDYFSSVILKSVVLPELIHNKITGLSVLSKGKLVIGISCKVSNDTLITLDTDNLEKLSVITLPQKHQSLHKITKSLILLVDPFYKVNLISLKKETTTLVIESHKNSAICLLNMPVHSIIVSGSFSGEVKMWDMITSKCKATFTCHADKVSFSLAKLTNDRFVSASDDGKICIFDASNQTLIEHFKIINLIYSFVISSSQKMYFASYDCLLHVDFEKKSPILLGNLGGCKILTLIRWDASHYLIGSFYNYIQLYNINNNKIVAVSHTKENVCVLLRVDNHTCASSATTDIKIWDISKKDLKFTLVGHTKGIKSLTRISMDKILSGGLDGRLILWNVYNGQVIKELSSQVISIYSVIKLNDFQVVVAGKGGVTEITNLY